MNEEQFKQFLASNEKATGDAVQKFVNGKIDAMKADLKEHTKKHDAFMEEMKPVLQAKIGIGVIYKGLVIIGSIATAILATKTLIR